MKYDYKSQVEDYGSRYGLRVKFGKENKLIRLSDKMEKSKTEAVSYAKKLALKNNGKYLGIVDMRPKSNSSKRVKDYSYIKRSDISVLKATIDGKVLNVDPKDILSGSYVAKKVKSTAKKIRVAKIDSSKLRDKILNYAKKFYKKEYEEKLDPVYDSKVTTDDLDKFISCGLTEEMIMAFYCGFKSIMDIKSDGEFNYGFSGGIFTFQTEGGYIEKHIKRAIFNCENDVYELGFKYPTFNWKSAGMKMSKTEVIKSAEYEGWRNTKKQAILKIETFKVKTNFTVLAVKDIGEVVDGKTEARYGQDELLDPKKPLDLNNDYLALVSRNGKELFALAKKLLSQTEGYVKDFDWLVQSKTFGAEMLTESKYKFAKGGSTKANLGMLLTASKLAPKSVDSFDTKIANRVSKKSFAERMSETGNEQFDNEKEQYSASNTFDKGGSTQVMLGNKLNKNYPEFKPTIQYAGDTLSLFTVFKDEDKNWSSEAQKMIDNEKRKGRRAAVIHKGGNHGLYLKAYFDKGGSTYSEGGEVYNAHILTNDNKLIHRRYPKKITHNEIYEEYKNKGIEIKDSQIHFAKPIDFYDTLRKETKKYVRENMNEDVDSKTIFISSIQKGNEYIASEIKGDTISGKAFTITPKDLFEVTMKNNTKSNYEKGGGVDFDPISYAKNAGKDAIDWMQELKNYAGEDYDSLTAEEKDSIISELQMDYDFSHSFAKGGGLNDVRYIPTDAIEKVELKNGKIIENSFNEPIYSGLRVKGNQTADQIKRKEMEEKGQLSIFKKGGNLPSGAAYIPKSKVAKIYTDEGVFLGENLVGGVWYDNSKTKKLIESARKRGLIK